MLQCVHTVDLIFVGRGENGMKIYKTMQNNGTVMHFLDQNLKMKNCEQLKHRNIVNETLWIYGILNLQ